MNDTTTAIWNRATSIDYEPVRPGDSALAAIIGFHGLVMNGGFVHALETDLDQAARASEGFQRFGANELSEQIGAAVAIARRASVGADELELPDDEAEKVEAVEARYDELIPDDATLIELFEAYAVANPDDFAPATA